MSEQLVVLMTAGSQEEAEQVAQALVSEMLAACVNVIPGVTSIYRWEGAVQRDQEWLLVAKSRRDVLDALVRRLLEVDHFREITGPGNVALRGPAAWRLARRAERARFSAFRQGRHSPT
mgnify:CR=1 FL=1